MPRALAPPTMFKLQDVIDGLKERPAPRKQQRQPIYRKQDYVFLIKKHYKECGLPEPDWLDEIPESQPPPAPSEQRTEPSLFSHDWVSLVLEYDETREHVNCRLSTALHDLHRDYYSQASPPPIETLVRAYKDIGFSDHYLMKLIDRHDRRTAIMKKFGDLDKIFKSDSSSKKKKKKDKPDIVLVEEEEDDVEDEEDEEEVAEEDDNQFDMEIDEDEENQDDVDEEEYISD